MCNYMLNTQSNKGQQQKDVSLDNYSIVQRIQRWNLYHTAQAF